VALSERDLRAVLDFVGEAYDAEDRAEFRSVLLPGIHRLVASEYVSYNEVEQGSRAAVSIVSPELPDWAAAAWGRHAQENPLLQHYLRTRDGRSLRFSDVASLEQLRRTPIFEQLYLPLGNLEHQVAFVLPSTPELTIAVAMSRAGRDYTERECRLLELARPHLIQAYRGAQLRERLSRVLEGLRAGLDAEATAIVVIDAGGSVTFVSSAAQELLDDLQGRGPLQAGITGWAPLASWLEAGGGTASLPIDGQEDSLLVRSVNGGGGTRVILFERAAAVLSLEALRQLGLTPREAEVLHGLARGEALPALAAKLEVAPRTVAKHSQRIHAKLGVSSRAQAVATAWAATSGGLLSLTQFLG
jgi:DNA-binding CsgD family transcriptional regulator/PAS domain-containing protein